MREGLFRLGSPLFEKKKKYLQFTGRIEERFGWFNMKFFSVDSTLYRFLSKFLDVLKLNFLWIIFSLPIITMGASTAAAMSMALKMTDDEEGYIGRGFVKAFKENWKQGTALEVIMLIAFYAIYLDFQFFNALEGNPTIFLVIGIASIVIAVSALIYTFPLIARYENTLFHTIQNSIDITRKYFGKTILMVLILVVEYVIFNFNTTMVFFGIIVGPGFMILTIAGMSKRIFTQIEKEPGAVVERKVEEEE